MRIFLFLSIAAVTDAFLTLPSIPKLRTQSGVTTLQCNERREALKVFRTAPILIALGLPFIMIHPQTLLADGTDLRVAMRFPYG